MIQYFTAVTADRRAHPGEDLASVIANARFPDGRRLDDAGTIGYYAIVATAGHDTTSSTLAGGLEALVRNPEQLALLQREPARLENAVEEMIRWVTPVRHFLRHAQEDYVLRGKQLRKGDVLLMSYLSANRDEDVFADSQRFDVGARERLGAPGLRHRRPLLPGRAARAHGAAPLLRRAAAAARVDRADRSDVVHLGDLRRRAEADSDPLSRSPRRPRRRRPPG